MLEGGLKNLETAFRRLSEVNGGDWGGGRDKAFHHIDDAAKHLIAAIKVGLCSGDVTRLKALYGLP
jgi:hypothetical protein